ncbi:MAG: acylphosphatase [Flavobacteriales bacterium]|nr:MAG: acylphosphatase [Flavobacteriales bacterium]
MERIHLDLSITGKVQGVWYRKTAVQEASVLGLTGYAMNLPDGSVRIEVEGEPAAVERFIAWCHHGPPLARVHSVHRVEGPVVGYTSFETKR